MLPFKPGDRIELTFMGDDPDPLPGGLRGTVISCQDLGSWVQVNAKWDNGRTLALTMPPDMAELVVNAKYEQFNLCCPRCHAGPYEACLKVTYIEAQLDDVLLEPDGFDVSLSGTRMDTTNEQVTCRACGATFPLDECLLTEE